MTFKDEQDFDSRRLHTQIISTVYQRMATSENNNRVSAGVFFVCVGVCVYGYSM